MADDPSLDRFGEPADEPDEGMLLFDPSMPIPEGHGAGFEEERPPSPLRRIATIILILAGIAAMAYQAFMPLAEPSAEADELRPPVVDPVPGADRPDRTVVAIPRDEHEAPIGTRIQLAVRVSQAAGVAWGDTLVEFRVESGAGTLTESQVRTTVDGIATTMLTLPLRPGETVVLAGVPGSMVEEARILATAVPGTPERMEIASGDRQAGEIGQLLPSRLEVRLTDAQGNPIPEASVQFRIESGGGMTAPSRTRTDTAGVASALWRLGMQPGPQRLVATTPYMDAQVAFDATATAPTADESESETPVEAGPVTVVPNALAVGAGHTCSLANGSLICRGGNERGQIAVQGTAGLTAIAAGSSHTCGLGPEGLATCWGANEAGQLGDGTRTDRSTAVQVRTDLRFSQLAAGSQHTCGLAGGGIPLCWGLNLSGQLGDGTRNDQTLPRTVGGGMSFRRLAAGWSHTCGLTSSGNAFCWGLNSQGQLGDGSRLDRLTPTLVRGAVQAIVAGSAHTCAISRGTVLCWGDNAFGQLGNGTREGSPQPVEVQGISGTPAKLTAGGVHTCALTTDGTAWCWGQNLQGQLGDGATVNRETAVQVTGGLQFSEIYAGGAQTCATTAAGVEYCWGLNSQGQIGDGSRVNRSVPTRVGG